MSIEDQVANLTYLYLRYDCNLQLKYHTNYLERMTLVINYLHRAFKRLATTGLTIAWFSNWTEPNIALVYLPQKEMVLLRD